MKYFFLLLFFAPTLAFTQFNDDFTDGDFTSNPTWFGDAPNFEVDGSFELHLDAPAISDESYLSTPSIAIDTAQWDAYVRLEFNPSSANRARVYLVSSSQNLEGSLNGYFVQIGNTEDEVSLYRQTGTSVVKIIDGVDDYVDLSTVEVLVRATRSNNGTWELLADTSLTNTFTSMGTVQDTTYLTSSFFGVWCDYTSTRSDKFYFDDISVTGNAYLDTAAPEILDAVPLGADSLRVLFNEPVDPVSATINSNYSVNNSIGSPLNTTMDGDSAVMLTFSNSFVTATPYQITVSNVEDTSGNDINNGIFDFTFYQFGTPEFKSIILNEIMANPTPQVGLPVAEYVELFNPTTEAFDLSLAEFADANDTINFSSSTFILAGQHIILCKSSDTALFSSFGEVLGLSNFPALNNSDDDLKLLIDGVLIDRVTYNDGWYFDDERDGGGYSLELINPESYCIGPSNWRASLSNDGGTPGSVNSVFTNQIDTAAPTIQDILIIDKQTILLTFSKAMDSTTLANAGFILNTGNIVSSVQVSNIPSFGITLYLQGQLDSSVVQYLTYSNTITDCLGNTFQEDSIEILIGITPSLGDVVINELYPDPDSSSSIPNVEFVEIYNRSDKLIRLGQIQISDASNESNLDNMVLFPKEYAIICDDSHIESFEAYGKVIPTESMPSLNNAEDAITLKRGSAIIDEVSYSDSWYGDDEKENGGYTLERINPETDCTGENNWIASISVDGGTPGARNSVYTLEPDTSRPIILAATVVDEVTISLEFNKSMDTASLSNAEFSLSNGVNIQSQEIIPPTFSSMRFQLQSPLDSSILYRLSYNNEITDCPGNPLVMDTILIGLGVAPKPFDIIINELYPDPAEASGIPEIEFVEVFNRSDKLLRLESLELADRSTSSTLATSFLQPYQHAVVCDDGAVDRFESYGLVIPVGSMPSLNNSEDAISLLRGSKVIDEVNYNDSWYGDDELASGGYTLERINPDNLCGLANNWAASSNVSGGSPGVQNSIFSNSGNTENVTIDRIQFLSINSASIFFNQRFDSLSAATSKFQLNGNSLITQSLNPELGEIQVEYQAGFDRGLTHRFMVDSLDNCAQFRVLGLYFDVFLHDTNDVVINEVLFNPRGSGTDFVELYNQTNSVINIQNWSLAYYDSKDSLRYNTLSEVDMYIDSKDYLALNEDGADLDINYPNSIGEPRLQMDLPSYPNDSGSVILYDQLGTKIEEFNYSEDLHFSLIDNPDGVSLERLSVDRAASDRDNWHSASSTENFATPGYVNSQDYSSSNDGAAFTLSSEYISPDNDGYQDVVNIDYSMDQPGHVASVNVYNDRGMLIRSLYSNQVLGSSGSLTWDGTNDKGEKARSGIHIVLVETFDLKGNRARYRLPVVVATRL